MQIVTDRQRIAAYTKKTPLQRAADRASQEAGLNSATLWILQQEISDSRKVELCLRVQSIGRWLPSQCSIYAAVVNEETYADCMRQRSEQLLGVSAGLGEMWQEAEAESVNLPQQPETEPDELEWNPTDGEIQDMM